MKKITALFLALLLTLSLCACGSSAKYSDTAVEAPAAAPMPYPTEMEMAAAEEMGYGGFSANSVGTAERPEKDESLSAADINPDKIIYSANATVETTEFDSTITALEQMVAEFGGFVESSSLSGSNYYSKSRGYAESRYANYTIRIPSKYFSTLMSSLSALGNVPYSYTYSENITAQYYDVQARLTAYKTQEASLLAMMEKAETISDVIAIEDKLTDLRYEIESLQSTINNWDRQVNYSTISLSIEEVRDYTPEAPVSYGQQLRIAFVSGLKNAGEFFKDLLVDILAALPLLIFLAVVIVVVVLLVKTSRKKKAARMAAQYIPPVNENK